MALQPEIWQAQIVGNLYKDNEFLTRSTNADEYVVGGAAVHIPQSGAASGVSKNRTSLPATVSKRTDTDITYGLDEYTTDPILIPNIDNIQLSYDKRASVMAEDQAKLKEAQAEAILFTWGGSTTNIIYTTGQTAATTLTGATGTRKLFTKEDLRKAKVMFDKQNIPADGRTVLLTPEYLEQLLADTSLAVNFVQYANIAEGIVGRVYGFDILVRASSLSFDKTTNAAKAPGSAAAGTDNVGCLAWSKYSVERALGTVKMFEQLNNPLYYGDVYSFLVMLGGRVRRADGKGIAAIVETWVS
ncbi:phage capsid protein [Spirosoma lituiforme]